MSTDLENSQGDARGSGSWLRRPQNKWLRRALFQIHLWSGLGIGLYVLAISISGSAIVFRNEIYDWADTGPKTVEVRGEPLSADALKAKVREAYPGNSISFVWPGKDESYATEVWMDDDGSRVQRLFDPYTGEDIGPSVPYAIQWVSWFFDLHTVLLTGETGEFWNGVGAILLTLLTITGGVVWWPGIAQWKRNLIVNPKSGWKRINWDLHSAVGFWSFGLVFMWAVTGIFLIWPSPFQQTVNYFSPLIQYRLDLPSEEEVGEASGGLGGVFAQPASSEGAVVTDANPGIDEEGREEFVGFGELESDAPAEPESGIIRLDSGYGPVPGEAKGKGGRRQMRRSAGDIFLRWFYYLHFGNFMGWKVKALWVVLGLIPSMLFVTGLIMWWNRVITPKLTSRRRAKS